MAPTGTPRCVATCSGVVKCRNSGGGLEIGAAAMVMRECFLSAAAFFAEFFSAPQHPGSFPARSHLCL